MVVGGSRQETLDPGFVLVDTRHNSSSDNNGDNSNNNDGNSNNNNDNNDNKCKRKSGEKKHGYEYQSLK
ncbi:unnamed protein product [Schistosoma margrebowiei]|uniref:Uncharacterized protein n=1 Tax=Schistosoma margrebowiei TaxID=48269 RepID=A0A183M659_9TREM|nr:unnamed protein product [Schistosoma margrebowiei]